MCWGRTPKTHSCSATPRLFYSMIYSFRREVLLIYQVGINCPRSTVSLTRLYCSNKQKKKLAYSACFALTVAERRNPDKDSSLFVSDIFQDGYNKDTHVLSMKLHKVLLCLGLFSLQVTMFIIRQYDMNLSFYALDL